MNQPECAACGTTEINYVSAAANGWVRALGALRCATCALRLPAWMRCSF